MMIAAASSTEGNIKKKGRPVIYTEKREKSHYWIPSITKDKLTKIADKLGLTITDTFILLVEEEYKSRKLQG